MKRKVREDLANEAFAGILEVVGTIPKENLPVLRERCERFAGTFTNPVSRGQVMAKVKELKTPCK